MSVATYSMRYESRKILCIGIGVQSNSGPGIWSNVGAPVSLFFVGGPHLSPSFTLKMQELQGIMQERKDGGVR